MWARVTPSFSPFRGVLHDGGRGTSEGYGRGVRPYLREHGIDRLDLLVLTHPHDDHLGGLVRMLEEDEIRVAHVLESGYPHTTRGYARFWRLLPNGGCRLPAPPGEPPSV